MPHHLRLNFLLPRPSMSHFLWPTCGCASQYWKCDVIHCLNQGSAPANCHNRIWRHWFPSSSLIHPANALIQAPSHVAHRPRVCVCIQSCHLLAILFQQLCKLSHWRSWKAVEVVDMQVRSRAVKCVGCSYRPSLVSLLKSCCKPCTVLRRVTAFCPPSEPKSHDSFHFD